MKRIISIFLTIIMILSMATISVSANNGEKTMSLITDVVKNDVELYTYHFYMPEEWKSQFNDWGDGYAGIYWWTGPYSCENWPGYAVKESNVENVYTAQVPVDVQVFIWNNAVDSGYDITSQVFKEAHMTKEILADNYSENSDIFGFYPDGLDNFNNMIYVVDVDNQDYINSIDVYSTLGEWFYYYGNGQYGPLPTLEEAIAKNKVFSDGEFPNNGFEVGIIDAEIEVGEETLVYPNNINATATVTDPKIVFVEKNVDREYFVVKGLKAGKTTIKIQLVNEKTGKVEEAEVEVKVYCDHIKNTVKGKKSATYFAKGYTGDKVCTICDEVIKKGKDVPALKLNVPTVKITGGKKKITVKYTKVSGAKGFEVKYKLGKKVYTKTFATKKSANKVIKKLAKGTYKVQVRVFTKKGSNIAYSKWTKATKVKVK